MLRTRLLLALAGVLSTSWFFAGLYWINYVSSPHRFTLADLLMGSGVFLGPILFLASILMFVFSFFRVSETGDGRLEYDSSNYHWKLLKNFFELEGNVSLCKAYWLTTLLTFMSVLSAGSVLFFTWLIYAGEGSKLLATLPKILPLLALLGSLFIPHIPFHLGLRNELARKLSACLLVIVFLSWFIVLPFYSLIYNDGLTMSGALMKYLGGIGQLVLWIIPLYAGLGLMYLLVKYISKISSDSLLKRLFSTLKGNMCPILYEHPTAGK